MDVISQNKYGFLLDINVKVGYTHNLHLKTQLSCKDQHNVSFKY